MPSDLPKTWNDVAHHWDDWGPPLRPCEQDLRIMRRMLELWHRKNPVKTARLFLCGVTPEIVTMPWPFPIELIGMDQAESMVNLVWPGDVPGERRAFVGNWLDSGLPEQSRDIVIGDGGFGFYDFPHGQRALMAAIRKLLVPGGLFLYRHYAQITPRESMSQVFDDLLAHRISNFHIFKWRLAMALQPDSSAGVRQHDIWQAWTDARIDTTTLPQPGFASRAVSTIRFYRDKQARLFLPTLDEFRGLVAEHFDQIEVQIPNYELGERCPILAAV